MNNVIINSDIFSDRENLEKLILEKESTLLNLLSENEKLKLDLFLIKKEYEIKIGRSYIRLDEIDLEILKFKKIENLLKEGVSFEDAKRSVEEKLKDNYDQIGKDYKKIEEEEISVKKLKVLNNEEKEEIKKLYRKLARRFHPDFNDGDDAMMKKVNEAYSENDIESLRAFDKESTKEEYKKLNVEELRSKLEDLEKSIISITNEYKKLKNSEWVILKENIEKAKIENRDLLNELSEKITEDILIKEKKLDDIKQKYGQ